MSQTPAVERHVLHVHLIAAVASNGVIGAWGKLPWYLPEDLQHFKALTYGHPVIMGRRTWHSLGKPLPGRDNVVVTRRQGYAAPGASVASSLESALALCADSPLVYVIGGAELYATALAGADVLLLTEIQRAFEGDARFPDFDRGAWRESARVARATADGLRYDFVRYERARPDSKTLTSGSGKPLNSLA
ncbi:MAG TPA: dihydrofolate reductase [Burkholderiales bacterium]|nr:dihydrofolate reductase [Burkholderiales bacterium]